MTNQSDRQASVRAVTGTIFPYEGDWHALWDLAGIPLGTYNERMLAWINQSLSASYTELNGAMAAYAISQGVTDWNSLGTFIPAGAGNAYFTNDALTNRYYTNDALTNKYMSSGGSFSVVTVPAAFTTGQWTLTDSTTGGTLLIDILTLPSNGGSSITDLKYRLNGGVLVSLASATTGQYSITGLTDDIAATVEIFATNTIGDSASSGRKSATPTGVEAETPLRTIASHNQIFSGVPSSSTRNSQSNVIQHVIATDAKDIIVRLPNWSMTESAEVLPGNDLTFLGVSLTIGGVNVPVYFDGVRSIVVPDGSTGELSDPVLPSAFGIGTGFFARNTLIECKYIIQGPTSAKIPTITSNNPYSDFGGQCRWFDSAVTTPSTIDAAGAFTFTGTAPTTANQGYKLQLVGHPVVDGPSVAIVGASLGAGQSDSDQDAYGRGYDQRMLHDGTKNNPYPAMNICRETANVLTFNNMTRWIDSLQFCNCAVVDVCGNDLQQGQSGATIYARLQTLWAIIYSNEIYRIMQVGIGSATSSTDSWRTYANQTLLGIVPAGIALTDLLRTAETNGEIQVFEPFDSLRDPALSFKWLVDGNPNYIPSADGVHYSPSGYTVAAASLRPRRDVLFATPYPEAFPVVSGTAPYDVASVLTVDGYGTWAGSPAPTFTGEWYDGGSPTGDTDFSHTISTGNSNYYYEVTADNGVGPPVVIRSNTVTSAPAGSFVPTDLTAETELFLFAKDAATLGLTGSAVDSWADKSNKGRNATGSGAARGTYEPTGLNGFPTVAWTSASLMTFSDLSVVTGNTIYIVAQVSGTSNKSMIGSSINGALEIRANNGENITIVSRGVGVRLTGTTPLVSGTPAIIMAELQPGGTRGRLAINGVVVASNLSGAAFTAITNPMNRLFSNTGAGKMSAVSVHRGVLATADHNQLLQFYGTNFGISYTNM